VDFVDLIAESFDDWQEGFQSHKDKDDSNFLEISKKINRTTGAQTLRYKFFPESNKNNKKL
jgi:hypothetical protein